MPKSIISSPSFSTYIFRLRFCKNNDFSSISIDGGGDYNSWMSIGLFKNRKLKKWTSNCGFEYYNSKLKKTFFPNVLVSQLVLIGRIPQY